jgi:hypothetical protein
LVSYVKEELVVESSNFSTLKYHCFSGVKEVCKNQSVLLSSC